jgi:hypothetical protein
MALDQIRAHRFAPFTLVFAGADRAWALGWDDDVHFDDITDGWHVITHAELDDADEPRTSRLLRELGQWRPESIEAARAGTIARLAQHDEPRVCLHEGRMRTVSFSFVAIADDRVTYLHGEGRPCERVAEVVPVPRRRNDG